MLMTRDTNHEEQSRAPSQHKPKSTYRNSTLSSKTKSALELTNTFEKAKREVGERTKDYITKSPTNIVQWLGEIPLSENDPDNAVRTRIAKAVASILAVEPGEHFPEFMTLDFVLGGESDLPDGGNMDFLDSLKKWQITIKENDNKDLAAIKQAIFDSQLELIKDVEAGGTVNDSIRSAYEYRIRAAEFRDSLIDMIKTLHAEDNDRDSATRMISEANKKLKEKGFMEISDDDILPDPETNDDNENIL